MTYHLIFSTKYRRRTIRPEFRERLYRYIGGILREKDGVLLEIGGIEDQVSRGDRAIFWGGERVSLDRDGLQ
ncbi:MAG: transposase [Novipirellula sp. JB048]